MIPEDKLRLTIDVLKQIYNESLELVEEFERELHKPEEVDHSFFDDGYANGAAAMGIQAWNALQQIGVIPSSARPGRRVE